MATAKLVSVFLPSKPANERNESYQIDEMVAAAGWEIWYLPPYFPDLKHALSILPLGVVTLFKLLYPKR